MRLIEVYVYFACTGKETDSELEPDEIWEEDEDNV